MLGLEPLCGRRPTLGLHSTVLSDQMKPCSRHSLPTTQISHLLRHFQVVEATLRFLDNQTDANDQSCSAWLEASPPLGSRALRGQP